MALQRHLLIIGFPKCGTTSLFHLLQQHPEIAATATKETRLLTPAIREGRLPTAEELDEFAAAFPSPSHGATVGLEASPDTAYAPAETARAVAARLPGLHAVALVRNPTDRFWSTFQFKKARTTLDTRHPFDAFLEANIAGSERRARYGDAGSHLDFHLEGGRYCRYLRGWVDALDGRIALVATGALERDPRGVASRLAQWVGCTPLPESTDATRQNVTRRGRNPKLHMLAWRLNDRGERFFRRHPRLEEHLRRGYYAINGQPRVEMAAHQRAQVDDFYTGDLEQLQRLSTSSRLHGPVIGLDELWQQTVP